MLHECRNRNEMPTKLSSKRGQAQPGLARQLVKGVEIHQRNHDVFNIEETNIICTIMVRSRTQRRMSSGESSNDGQRNIRTSSFRVKLELLMDPTVAHGIFKRHGDDRVRHVAARSLWLHTLCTDGTVTVVKVRTSTS